MTRKALGLARKNKNDELFSGSYDVWRELGYYYKQLKGKRILCNANDGERSEFVRHLKRNYKRYDLAGLTYVTYPEGVVSRHDGKSTNVTKVKGGGDFKSPEVMSLLDECDVVVTNPPFSKFREFVYKIYAYHKDFLLIAPYIALFYNETRHRVFRGEVRLGINFNRYDLIFHDAYHNRKRVHACWITTLDHGHRNPPLKLTQPAGNMFIGDDDMWQNGAEVLNVNRYKDIPRDYFEPIAVPVTYLYHHCLEQFRIIDYVNSPRTKDGRVIFRRLIIQRVEGEEPEYHWLRNLRAAIQEPPGPSFLNEDFI